MRVSKVDFQQSEAPDWVQEGQEDHKATWFFAAANGCYSLCGRRFWIRCKNNEKAQRTCGNQTIDNFKKSTGTSKRQTGEGRLNGMCVQSSLCQLWRELHRRNEGNLESDYQNIGLKWNPKQDAHLLEAFMHQGIKFNSTQQIRSHWPHNSREPCHQLASSDGDRQSARAFYIIMMDQRGHTHPKGRTTGHELWWGQLPTEPRMQPLSWHGVFPSCQEPEELSTSFFWRRPLIDVETSSFRYYFGCVWWI